MLDAKMKELIAIGASISANCHPCVKFHISKAKKLEIDAEDIQTALEVGMMVRAGAAGQMDQLLCEKANEIGIELNLQPGSKETCE